MLTVLLAAFIAVAGSGLTIAGEAFSQADIMDARTVPDGSGAPALLLTFAPAGAAHLQALTTSHDGQRIPIAFDGTMLAEPTLHGPIDDGQMQLSGSFGSFDEAAALAKRISGKDPVAETGE